MSYRVEKPGKYRLRDGRDCTIVFIGRGKAVGFFGDDDEPVDWISETGMFYDNKVELGADIIGPWHDPPTPPEGFRLKRRDAKPVPEIDMALCGAMDDWDVVADGWTYTSEQADAAYPKFAPYWFAEPIPKPVIDPGEGWRLLCEQETPVRGDEHTFSCASTASWTDFYVDDFIGKTVGELREWKFAGIKFRRRIQPEPEQWTPTCELRWNNMWGRTIDSLVQKWTCGDKSEWRPLEVVE